MELDPRTDRLPFNESDEAEQAPAGATEPSGEARIRHLQRVPLFSGFNEKELRRVAELARIVDVPAGTAVTQIGEPGNSFFVIIDGVAVRTPLGIGAQLHPGEVFCEMSLLGGEPRSATIVATGKGAVVVGASNLDDYQLDAQGRRHLLRPLHLRAGVRLRRDQERDARGPRYCFLEQFQSLPCYRRFRRQHHPSDVATWPRKTCHKAEFNGIAVDQEHDDRNRLRRILRRLNRNRAESEEYVYAAFDQVTRQSREPVELARSESLLDRQILAFDVSHRAQLRREKARC